MRRDERGVAAIIISLCMVALMIITAMVLDFGFARYNRQLNKSTADAAVAAGMHGFDRSDGRVYAFKGVCDTLGYLKTNAPELTSLPAYAPCSDTPKLAKTCIVSDSATWASYQGNTSDGLFTVTIKAPYTLPDPMFPADSLTGPSTDVVSDTCRQLGVVITERRKSAVGNLATAGGKIVTTIRSAGRVKDGPGFRAPALLLLERHKCGVLTTGTNSSSTVQDNFIHVFGGGNVPLTQPGTIHADSDGAACGSNETIYQGKRLDGIVAYEDPNTSVYSPGVISSYAKRLGQPDALVSDLLSGQPVRVYGSTEVTYQTTPTTKFMVSDLGLITRKIVDDRYLAGLKTLATQSSSFWTMSSAPTGWVTLSTCTGNNQTAINALDNTKNLYVDCAQYKGEGTFNGFKTVFFSGSIEQQAKVYLPDATRVYVKGPNSGAAINSTGNDFRMNHHGASACPTSKQSTGQESAKLIVYRGGINNNNGTFQACYTTVLLLSGYADGCLPPLGTVRAPTDKPCGTTPGTAGSGTLDLGGGGSGHTRIDWTAPNQYDASIRLLTQAGKQAAWDAGEDLAFWSETWSSGSFKMSGGADLDLKGVFMTPNADPFTVTGGGKQDLVNAQYIATKFAVDGGAALNMTVDPDDTVVLPELIHFDLVR